MNIRAYQDADLEEVIALWTACGLVAPQNNPYRDIARKLKIDRDLFLIGHTDSEIIASVMGGYEGHRGWINYLAVKPSHQRKGFGQQIMLAVETLIKAKGCPKINLQVRSTNSAIIGFYHSLGYGDDHVVSLGKRLELDNLT